jgi:subtilisin family serine protease
MVVKRIAANIDPSKYCFLIIKWIDSGDEAVSNTAKISRVADSVNYAVKNKVKFINMSLSGIGGSDKEKEAVASALKNGVTVVVAAGNDNINLSETCVIYPACYGFKAQNFKVVGNFDGFNKEKTSNYGGPINAYEHGPLGTSEAAAIYLGKLIRGLNEKDCGVTCPFNNRVR